MRRSRHGLRRTALVGVLAVAAIAAGRDEAADVSDRIVRTFALPPPRAISVALTVGELHVSGGPGSQAQVEIVRRAPSGAALIPLRVQEDERQVRVDLAQADGGRDAALRTDVTVRLPAAAAIDRLEVFEGRIVLGNLTGRVTARIDRGPIVADRIAGAVRLATGIGPLTATHARLTEGGPLRLRTFNGTVKLGLAEVPRDARVMALALNGSIRSAIPLNMRDTWGPRWGEATLGRGEPVISIDVVNGDVEISRDGKG